ncbi:hypothetical protein T439DRAFT_357395 [Meredithblackwellia eburnea MCA 4105]
MADQQQQQRRRTTIMSHQIVPSSIPRPRHSLAPSSSTTTTTTTLQQQQQQQSTNSTTANPLIGRQSFAPRQSIAPQQQSILDPPSTVARSTNYYSSHALMSANKLPMSANRPPNSAYRRSTTTALTSTSLSHTPLAAAHTAQARPTLKDPRDYKSQESRRRYASEIVQFLSSRNYVGPGPGNQGGPATEKQLLQPTGAQFQAIFKFLVGVFDRNIKFNSQQKFEDQVVPVLNACLYPFGHTISKTHLQSIGGLQSWPNMLAMLHWFVESIQMRETLFTSSPLLHIPEPPYPDEEVNEQDQQPEDEAGDTLEKTFASWMEYVAACYPLFLHEDEFDNTEELNLFYGRLEPARLRLRTRVDQLQMTALELKAKWDVLVAYPDPIHSTRAEMEKCERDLIKISDYITKIQSKISQQVTQHALLVKKKDELRHERESGAARIQQLTLLIAAQGMSHVEIQNINSEKATLQTLQTAVMKRQEDKLTATMNLEVELQRRLNRAHQLCAVYARKAEGLGLIPTPPEGFEGVNFEQEINGAEENPVPDCLTFVKPAVVELRNRTRTENARRNGEDVILEERITRTKEGIAELVEVREVDELELDRAERENSDAKEAANAEHQAAQAEIQRLESQIHNLTSSMGQPLAQAEYRLSQRKKELDAERVMTQDVRIASRTALENALDDILNYRQHLVRQTDVILELARSE